MKKRCEVELYTNFHVQAVRPVMLDKPSGIYNYREHQRPSAAMTQHLVKCESELGNEDRRLKLVKDTEILASTQRGSMVLLTLEAIWIRELAPSINTKDEFRSRELTIRW